MKYFLSLMSITFIACTSLKTMGTSNKSLSSYKVYKIDSINTYYLIYARKGDSLYKIVSKKNVVGNCDSVIRLNSSYEFELHSSLTDFKIGKIVVSPKATLNVPCFYYDASTTICLEGDSIRDLYYADNVKGLCFIKK
jgi:hypothetical protein